MEPRRAQESPEQPTRAQESRREPRRAQESPGAPRRAQEAPGKPRRRPEEPRRHQEGPGGLLEPGDEKCPISNSTISVPVVWRWEWPKIRELIRTNFQLYDFGSFSFPMGNTKS